MARPRQYSDEEILDAARSCFFEDPNASTVTIAERVGLSQAALFKRFGTKMRLLLAAMGVPDAPPWAALADAGPDERPVPEQLAELGGSIQTFFTWLVPRIAVMKAVGLDLRKIFGPEPVPPPIRGYLALRGWFERAVEQGLVREADAGGLAISFLGAFQGRAFWRHMASSFPNQPFEDDEAYVNHVVELFWQGVAPKEDP